MTAENQEQPSRFMPLHEFTRRLRPVCTDRGGVVATVNAMSNEQRTNTGRRNPFSALKTSLFRPIAPDPMRSSEKLLEFMESPGYEIDVDALALWGISRADVDGCWGPYGHIKGLGKRSVESLLTITEGVLSEAGIAVASIDVGELDYLYRVSGSDCIIPGQ